MVKRLHRTSVARSLIFSFLAVLFSISLVNLLIHYRNMQLLKKEVENVYQTDLKYLAEQLDQNLSSLDLLCASLSIKPDIVTLNFSSTDSPEILLRYKDLLEQLTFYSQNTALEADITVFLKNKQVSLSSKDGKRIMDSQSGQKTTASEENAFVPSWHVEQASGSAGYLLSYERETSGSSNSGIKVMIQVDGKQIEKFLFSLEKQGNNIIFISDDNGKILFPGNLKIETSPLEQELSGGRQRGQFFTTAQQTKYRILYHRLSHANLYAVLYYQEAVIMKPLNDMMWLMVATLIVSAILGIFFILYAYKNLLNPIRELIGIMKLVKKGDLSVRAKENKREEFDFLSSQFNAMIEKIDNLINDVFAEKLQKQETQLKFLQSQINPHFLYNCMNFIYQMSVSENNDASGRMALYLGKYFRFITNTHLDTVKLGEEIDSIQAYIEIQKMRFKDKFICNIEVEGHLRNTVIPRMIIQPLIENSFVHGFNGQDDKENIWLRITSEDQYIFIRVADDGVGIPPEKLHEINASLQGPSHYGSGSEGGNTLLGLRNTSHRLKLFYGEQAGIKVCQREPAGTLTVITIPLDGQ